MTDVFMCETGQLTPASKRELKQAGIVVVEVKDPSRCQFIRASEVVSGDDLLWAAVDAIRRTYKENYNDSGSASRAHREQFATNISEIIMAQHAKRTGSTDAAT